MSQYIIRRLAQAQDAKRRHSPATASICNAEIEPIYLKICGNCKLNWYYTCPKRFSFHVKISEITLKAGSPNEESSMLEMAKDVISSR